MTPVAFGPGKSHLGIIRVNVKVGNEPGMTEIIGVLDGGTQYTINLVVDASSGTAGR
jgi:hypothetical protein